MRLREEGRKRTSTFRLMTEGILLETSANSSSEGWSDSLRAGSRDACGVCGVFLLLCAVCVRAEVDGHQWHIVLYIALASTVLRRDHGVRSGGTIASWGSTALCTKETSRRREGERERARMGTNLPGRGGAQMVLRRYPVWENLCCCVACCWLTRTRARTYRVIGCDCFIATPRSRDRLLSIGLHRDHTGHLAHHHGRECQGVTRGLGVSRVTFMSTAGGCEWIFQWLGGSSSSGQYATTLLQ